MGILQSLFGSSESEPNESFDSVAEVDDSTQEVEDLGYSSAKRYLREGGSEDAVRKNALENFNSSDPVQRREARGTLRALSEE